MQGSNSCHDITLMSRHQNRKIQVQPKIDVERRSQPGAEQKPLLKTGVETIYKSYKQKRCRDQPLRSRPAEELSIIDQGRNYF